MKIKILILFLVLFMTGCWNYKELNETAIATGMAIDYDKGEYEVSLLFANGKTKEEDKSQITLFSARGNTIYEAIKNISLTTPKDIYISHLSVVIISDEIAKNGLTPVLDYLLREPQSHQNFYIILAKEEKAKNILSIINPLADYPSQNITSSIKITEKLQARITNASFNKFVSKLMQKGISPVTNSIILIGNEENGTKKEEQQNSVTSAFTKLDTIGIFKDDKLVSWTTNDESIGINMLLNDIESLYLEIPCDNNNNIIVSTSSYKINNVISKNKINVNIKTNGLINEVGCNIDLQQPNNIEDIEKQAEKKLKDYTYKAIKKAKIYDTDIFGYGNMIYKKYPRYFNNIKDWNKEFQELSINVNIDLNLNNKGALEQTIGGLSK